MDYIYIYIKYRDQVLYLKHFSEQYEKCYATLGSA